MTPLSQALEAARTRDAENGPFLGTLKLYCRATWCVVRDVMVLVKEYDARTPDALRCPACRALLAVHGIETRPERAARADRDARLSVRGQLEQARARAAGLAGDAVSLTLDDSLPHAEELPA